MEWFENGDIWKCIFFNGKVENRAMQKCYNNSNQPGTKNKAKEIKTNENGDIWKVGEIKKQKKMASVVV